MRRRIPKLRRLLRRPGADWTGHAGRGGRPRRPHRRRTSMARGFPPRRRCSAGRWPRPSRRRSSAPSSPRARWPWPTRACSAGWTDGRAAISVADLMAMSSGLEFNEDYGDVTDVTRMLYLEPDMAAFAAAKPLVRQDGRRLLLFQRDADDAVPPVAGPGRRRRGRMAADKALRADRHDKRCPGNGCARHLRRLVLPLCYSARLGQRFGQFLLQDGVWNGRAILPTGFVAWMREAAAASNGKYGQGQLWLQGPQGGVPEDADPDAGLGLPEDIFWLEGHDGQSVRGRPVEAVSRRTHGPDAVEARLQAAGAGGGDSKAVGVEASAGRDQRFVSTACTA